MGREHGNGWLCEKQNVILYLTESFFTTMLLNDIFEKVIKVENTKAEYFHQHGFPLMGYLPVSTARMCQLSCDRMIIYYVLSNTEKGIICSHENIPIIQM